MGRRYVLATSLILVGVGVSDPAPCQGQATKQGAPATKDKAAELFILDKVHTFHLHLSAKEWEVMQPKGGSKFGTFPGFGGPKPPPQKPEAQPADVHKAHGTFANEFPWAHADFTAQGKTFKNVGLRFKGNYTYLLSSKQLKRSLKIALEHYGAEQRFHGQKTLNLSSGVTDPALLREALCYAVFRAAGVAAPRTTYAEVTLTVPGKYDNEYVGMYTLIEQVSNSFLKRHFKSSKGLLLKPEGLRGLDYLGENWDAYDKRYLPKSEASKKQQQRLIDFARLVNKSSDEQFRKEIAAYLDVDAFLRYVAVCAVTANLDSFLGFGHNYYLYLRADTDQFVFIPWDVDFSFGTWPAGGSAQQQMDLSLQHPHPGQNKLIDRLLAMQAVNDKYQKIVKEVSDKAFTRENLLKDIEAIEKATKAALARDKKASTARKEGGGGGMFGMPGMFGPPQSLRTFIDKRTTSITAQLAGKRKGFVPTMVFGGPPGGGPPGGGFPGGGPPGGGFPKFGPGSMVAKPAFTAADTDKNGKLKLDEARASAKKFFEECDKDKKGMLDDKTLAEGINRLMPPPPGLGGKPPAFPGFGPGNFVARSLLKALNAKDNKIAQEDWLAASERLFKEWDADKSAALTETEFTDGLNRLLTPAPGAFGFPGGGPQVNPTIKGKQLRRGRLR
jgi:spore coat protein CotH